MMASFERTPDKRHLVAVQIFPLFLTHLISLFASTTLLAQDTPGFQDDLRALIREIAEQSQAAQVEDPREFNVLGISDFALNLDTTLAQNNDNSEVVLQEDSITLNFQDADIRALIGTVSAITGKNFIVDPRVKGKVTLISGSRLKADQVYEIFLSVLDVHNFAAVDSSGLIRIIPANIVKQLPTPTSVSPDLDGGDAQITQVFSLKHASVQELTPILRPLLPPTSHFAPHIGSNTLVFTDTAANIDRILKIVSILDRPNTRSDIHVVMVQYANADKLKDIIDDVASSMFAESVEGGTKNEVNIEVDEGLNALIIQAQESQFNLLSALIDQLDVEREKEGNINVIYLRYAKAADLVSILNEISGRSQDGEEEDGRPRTKVSVQADEDTNALVIRADEEDYLELKQVVEKLDLRRSQVFVETIIAEVSNSKASEIGVEWQGLTFKSSGGQVSGNTNFSDGADGGFTLGVLNKFVTDLAGNIVPDLNVVLRLLRNDNNANILSTPNLLTLDNESAEIVVAQEVPFLTGQFISDASSSNSGGDGQTEAGVVNPFQTIERKNVGLTLKITPQINDGGAIRLEIEQEISSVSPTTVAGASDLITDIRSISATVLVDDGQIIVLGGLIRDDISDTFEWVPVLGKLPIIGSLFRKKAKRAVKRNLMVFLRPKIIRTPADLFEHTRQRYSGIQQQQEASLPDTRRMIKSSRIPVLPDLEEKAK